MIFRNSSVIIFFIITILMWIPDYHSLQIFVFILIIVPTLYNRLGSFSFLYPTQYCSVIVLVQNSPTGQYCWMFRFDFLFTLLSCSANLFIYSSLILFTLLPVSVFLFIPLLTTSSSLSLLLIFNHFVIFLMLFLHSANSNKKILISLRGIFKIQ